jgi:hypothetical protein
MEMHPGMPDWPSCKPQEREAGLAGKCVVMVQQHPIRPDQHVIDPPKRGRWGRDGE